MNDTPLQRQIEAARAYEELFVPALFEQYAAKVADAVNVDKGERVLDVACGTGILAREILRRVGPGGRVAGIDPVPGMIEIAKQNAPTIEWHEGKAESLPFADDSFDVVVSQFGLMFFTDRTRAIQEMLRVLTSGGRFAVAVWDSLENIPVYASVVELLQWTAGQEAADALRAPFVLGDQHKLSRMFSEIGANSIQVTTHPGRALFPSIRMMVEAELRGWLPVMGVTLFEEKISQILNEAETALGAYATINGQIQFELSAHIVTGDKIQELDSPTPKMT